MVAALRSESTWSIHAQKNHSSSIDQRNLWFLRQADAIELNDLFRRLEKEGYVQDQINPIADVMLRFWEWRSY
jgi:isocitrate lyase